MADETQYSFRHNIKRAGGIAAVAKMTGFGYQTVWQWFRAGSISRPQTREAVRQRGINPYNFERY